MATRLIEELKRVLRHLFVDKPRVPATPPAHPTVANTISKVKLSSYLRPDHIRLGLAGMDRNTALRTVAELLRDDPCVTDFEEFFRGILKREQMMSTGIGLGVAVPYAMSDAVTGIVLAVGCFPEGIDFQSLDSQPVTLVFLSGIPTTPRTVEANRLHLGFLGGLAKLLYRDSVRTALLRCVTPESFIDVIRQSED
jgi:mannitol/fructose-specific phosphotransferase system IIA component (Ntr-type)